MRNRLRLVVVPALLALPLAAQNEVLLAGSGETQDLYGSTLDWRQFRLLIGAPGDDESGPQAGKVIAFDHFSGYGWQQPFEIRHPEGYWNSRFGQVVDVDGDTLIAGVPGTLLFDDDGAVIDAGFADGRGSAMVFVRQGGNWVLEADLGKLAVDEIAANEFLFGRKVALSGDVAVVGGESYAFVDPDGPAFVFERSGSSWSLVQTLFPSDGGFNTDFGDALAVDGDTIVVGASQKDDKGAAYVFEKQGASWVETAKLAVHGLSGDQFGSVVAIDGDRIAVSAPQENPGTANDAGVVHTWTRVGGNWVYEHAMSAASPVIDEALGIQLSLDGDRVFAKTYGRVVVFDAGVETGAVVAPGADPFSVGMAGEGNLLAVMANAVPIYGDYVYTFEELPGTGWTSTGTLTGSASSVQGTYGIGLAMQGGRLAVGAYTGAGLGTFSGLAEVLEHDGANWSSLGEAVPPDFVTDDGFGAAIEQTDHHTAVGAPNHDSIAADAGRVWICNGSQATQRLDAPGAAAGDRFGAALASSGDWLAAGAPGTVGAGSATGAVHLFGWDGGLWGDLQSISAPADAGPGFGAALAMDGTTLLVGAEHATSAQGPDRGAVYVYVESGGTWSLEAKLESNNGEAGDAFGVALDLVSDRAVVGAPGFDVPADDAGAVYTFDRDGTSWSQVTRIHGRNSGLRDEFGRAVTMDANRLLVGSPGQQIPSEDAGSTVLFRRCGIGWVELEEYFLSGGDSDDRFGSAVALGDFAFAGAPFADGTGSEDGSVLAIDDSSIGTLYYEQNLLQPWDTTPLDISICGGEIGANQGYWILGSISGTTPGFDLLGFHIPLNPDFFFDLTVNSPNQPPLVNYLGTLDPYGVAYAKFQLPNPLPASISVAVRQVLVVFDPSTSTILFVGNPQTFSIT